MKRTVVFLVVVLGFLFSPALGAGFDFIWDPAGSSYQNAVAADSSPFYALDPLVAAGLPSDGGYGTTANGLLNYKLDGTVAYGGAATPNLSTRGIVNRQGHFYFGFANQYPNSDVFADYELGNTPLSNNEAAGNACELSLVFRRVNPESNPINFIGICGGDGGTQVRAFSEGGIDYLRIDTAVTNPVHSPTGQGNAQTAFGMYINYGDYDDDNVGVDYYGSTFSTNIHWWDIDVPAIPRQGVAAIGLRGTTGEKTHVAALVPDAFFTDQGIDPANVEGYIDGNKLPMSDTGDYRYWYDGQSEDIGVPQDLNLDGVTDPTGRYFIYNDQWSEHDLGVGIVPEPATMSLLALGGVVLLRWRRK